MPEIAVICRVVQNKRAPGASLTQVSKQAFITAVAKMAE